MPISLSKQEGATPASAIIKVRINGKLSRQDYEFFESDFQRVSVDWERIRLLLVLDEFDGWTPGALWEDVKFDARHYSDVERVAIVGDSKWAEAVTVLYKPFTKADVRYFDELDERAAHEWVMTV